MAAQERTTVDHPDQPEVWGPGTGGPPVDGSRLAAEAEAVLASALPADQRDDRFGDPWPPPGLIAAVERAGGSATGYLGGTVDCDRLQLDLLLAPGEDPTAGLDARATALWTALGPAVAASGASDVELWGRPARPWHDRLAAANAMTEVRALHQLRCTLPVPTGVVERTIETRPFDPATDAEALLEVNNRAFAAHPDQGGMTLADLEASARQDWFRPDGIRLLDDPDRPGRLAGFCWTKIHEPLAPGQPALGEIYAIGIDPDHHGRGLGVPMTAAGLHWLADQGLTTGMLYVEADNAPALATYARLGFTEHRTDRAWRAPIRR